MARRLAKEEGVDLSQVAGTGPGGRIVKKDVEKAAAEGARSRGLHPAGRACAIHALANRPPLPTAAADGETAKGTVTVEELSRLQQVVARRMSESKATAPHFYLEAEIDMSRRSRPGRGSKAAAGEGEVVPSFNDMVVKACALALKEFPRANGSYKDGRFELYSRVNVGVAVAAQDALVVPTVFDADRKGLRQIATESRGAGRQGPRRVGHPARALRRHLHRLQPGDVRDRQLQRRDQRAAGRRSSPSARSSSAPRSRDGEIVPAHLMGVTLACDHRILYGADGAQFLARIKALLEEPLALAL